MDHVYEYGHGGFLVCSVCGCDTGISYRRFHPSEECGGLLCLHCGLAQVLNDVSDAYHLHDVRLVLQVLLDNAESGGILEVIQETEGTGHLWL